MLIIAVIFLAVILIMISTLFSRVASYVQFGSNSIMREQAVNLAEAGVDNTIWQLNVNAGSCPAITCSNEISVGSTGTFKVTIANKTSELKTITSKGCIPNCTNPRSTKTIRVDTLIGTDTISFKYAVQVGTGGVDMENSSLIGGTNGGNVYSNGDITGSGSSKINGDAYAVGSISSPDPEVTGTKHPGASPQPMPIEDPSSFYQEWKVAAEAIQITNCPGGTCSYTSGSPSLKGKYGGNLILQNSAQAVMDGTIWVTGNVTVKNSASLKLNDSFGSNGSVLITDGNVDTDNSGGFIATNANPKGYILIVTTSTATSGAITVKNTGVNAIFYALDGGAIMQNSAQVTALVAKQLNIKNSATLTYDQGLAGAQFSSGPGGSWQIKKGTYRIQ